MDNKSPERERGGGGQGGGESDGGRRVRMRTSEQLEVENLYDEDNVVGESRKTREAAELVADLNHAAEAGK